MGRVGIQNKHMGWAGLGWPGLLLSEESPKPKNVDQTPKSYFRLFMLSANSWLLEISQNSIIFVKCLVYKKVSFAFK